MSDKLRDYNSETDYHVILEACRKAGEIAITPVASAFSQAGIRWPNLNNPQTGDEAIASAIDRDIRRAWKQLGYRLEM